MAPPKAEPIDLEEPAVDRAVVRFELDAARGAERAIESGYDYIAKRLTPADLVAIASVGSTLQDQDFTADRATLTAALDRFSGVDTVGFHEGTTLTGEETEADGFVADDSEFNIFNTDRRLAAIEQLSDTLARIGQKKKSMVYSAAASPSAAKTTRCSFARRSTGLKANVSIYPVDTRGLTAIVPGGFREPGEWTRRLIHVFRTRRVEAVRQPGGQPGYARRPSERHGGQSVPRHE